jgi:hypothetical protein
MLHTPNYDIRGRAFCGPTAIAAITGEPISVIREVIRSQIGTKIDGTAMPVMGISNKVMLRTMEELGWRVIKSDSHAQQIRRQLGDDEDVLTPAEMDIVRFGDFLDYVQMHEHVGPYIVNVTRHYYAVDADEVCDTHTQIPVEIHRFKRGRRRWVQKWWQFEKL